MTTQKPKQDKDTDAGNEANPRSVLEKQGDDISEKESDTEKEDGKVHQQCTADSNKDEEAETARKGTDESSFKCTLQKGQQHMDAQEEIEQQRNNKGQGISSSSETGKTKETRVLSQNL